MHQFLPDTPPVLLGDVNGDTLVNLTDTILSLQSLAGSLQNSISIEADVNKDGKIGLEEAINDLQVISELRAQPDDNVSISSHRSGIQSIK